MKRTIIITMSLIICFSGCLKRPKNEYVASPDFSEVNFAKIQPGMTLHEVLDILGVPLSVFGPIQGANEYSLEYTGPSSASLLRKSDSGTEHIKYHGYSVRFDASNLVTKLHNNEVTCEYHEGIDRTIHANENYQRQIGKLKLQSTDGTSRVLDSNDTGLYIIVLTRGGCSGDSCSITSEGPSWLHDSIQEMLDSGIVKEKCYLYIGDQTRAFADSVKLLGKTQASKFYIQTDPAMELTTRDNDSRILLYKSGRIYSVPPISFALDENNQPVPYEVEIRIQKWLINKLGTK